VPYQRYTLTDLQALIAERTEAKPWWTADQSRRALNEGLRIWNAATGFWPGQEFRQTVPNDPMVALTGTLTRAARVLWNGIPLEKASLLDFDYGIPNWRSAVSGASGHPDRPVYWAPVSLNLLYLYPADAAGLHSLEINGILQTPVLVDALDTLDLNEADLPRLLDYALHVLTFTVGGSTFTATYPAWLAFLQGAGEQNSQFAASSFYRRVLGLDQTARLKRQRVPAPAPVDDVRAAAARLTAG